MNTVQASQGKWFGILSNLGVDQKFLKNRHGPCPLCGGIDRFRFDDKQGSGSYFCSHCGPGKGMDLAMKFTDKSFKETASEIDKMVSNIQAEQPKPKRDPRNSLAEIYKQIQDPKGTPVEKYLNNRGLPLPEKGIKFAPFVKYFEDGKLQGQYPAMVSYFTNAEGKPITFHVTYLTEDGHKLNVPSPRKIMTPTQSLAGGAIRLYEPKELAGVKTMGVAEGIETAIAASVMHANMPVWACANANTLESWLPPNDVELIYIFGDNDRSYTGHASSYLLAKRLTARNISVIVDIPDIVGDWNDVLLKQKGAA